MEDQHPSGKMEAPSFDDAAWLARVAAAGAAYALTGNRRLVFGMGLPDDANAQVIVAVIGELNATPTNAEAVKAYIERRQCGEIT